MNSKDLVAGFFGVVGGVCLIVVFFIVASNIQFLSQAQVAEGTVINNIRPKSTSKAMAPQIRFSTTDGQTIVFASNVSSNPPEFQVGQKIKVLYNPKAPQASPRPDSFISMWLPPILLAPFALIFSGIGFQYFTQSFLKNRKQKRPL
ncbi:MAG: DUF3592 domain-containing protein [Chloroflexota bacterium]